MTRRQEEKLESIRFSLKHYGASAKAKAYDENVEFLLDVVEVLRLKLEALKADPEKLSKLEVAAKIDPDHLQRLLALEKAVCSAGYCGMPTAG